MRNVVWAVEMVDWLYKKGVSGAEIIACNTDKQHLDFREADKKILVGEDRFFETWGKSRLAVLVGQAPDMQSALALGEQLAGEVALTGNVPPSRISSLTMLWPSMETMRKNEKAWQRFWSAARIDELRENLLLGGMPYGYREDAFEQFMSLIEEHSIPEQLPELGITERYIRELSNDEGGGYQVSVYFPDEADAVSAVMKRIEKIDNAYQPSPLY